MNRIVHYLQEHLLGDVTSAADVRAHFAHDASILELQPAVVVYPRDESDVRKAVRFAWQLAERGKKIPVTARGLGSNTSGAAIGSGILLVFPGHMNKLLNLNVKKRFATVQPGANLAALEQTLNSHGLSLPAYPASSNYATVGGALADNAIGEKSVKYGSMGDNVQSLRVVLSNGEVIETGPLSKKEFSHKLGLTSMEGGIYRSLDKLLEENNQFIERCHRSIKARHNGCGYNLFNVKKNDEFDLTPLIVGSQGTLGAVTEATLDVVPHNPAAISVLVSLDELGDLYDTLSPILELKPSKLDMLNRAAVKLILELNPSKLQGLSLRQEAAIHLFVEFDNPKDTDRKKAVRQLQKIIEKTGAWHEVAWGPEAKENHQILKDAVNTILLEPRGQAKAVPVAEDICVPVDRLVEYLNEAGVIYDEIDQPMAIWGHAGSGVVHMWPAFDLSNTGDRQKLFKLQGALYASAIQLGGSISASAGDGRVRAPYIPMLYGEEMTRLMLRVKKIFDPHDILNPGVKTASADEVKALLRTDYSFNNYDYLPIN